MFLYAVKRFSIISGVSKCLTFALIIKARVSVGKSSNLLLSKRVFASFKTSSSSLYIIKLKAVVRRSRSSSDSPAFSSQSNSLNVVCANSPEIFFNESLAASLSSTNFRSSVKAPAAIPKTFSLVSVFSDNANGSSDAEFSNPARASIVTSCKIQILSRVGNSVMFFNKYSREDSSYLVTKWALKPQFNCNGFSMETVVSF